MSCFLSNAACSQSQSSPSPSSVNPTNFAALIEKFQETHQALLAFCATCSPHQAADMAEEESAVPSDTNLPDSVDESPDNHGEVRCYHFSSLALRQERKLLEEYEAKDFHDLLLEAHICLSGTVELMKNLEPETTLNSTVVYSLGCLLERVSSLVFKIQDAYSTIEFVEA